MAMFRTVRHWWSEGSGQHTARLFVFEFVVVVAGVLVAQSLGEWMHDRETDRQVTEENARVEYQIGRTQQFDRVWSVAAPCFRERILSMIAAIDSGQRYPDDYLTLPALAGYTVEPVSPAIALPMRDKYGAKRMEDFFSANIIAESGLTGAKDLRDQWTKFAVLNPRYGTLEGADRASMRTAGAQALRDLGRIQLDAASLVTLGTRLRIAPIASADGLGGQAIFPAHNCDEIWRTGNIARSSP
jgi:hypothetical protein